MYTDNPILLAETSQWLTAPTITLLTAAQVGMAMRVNMPTVRGAQRLDVRKYRVASSSTVEMGNPETWGTQIGAPIAYTPGVSAMPEIAFETADAGNEVLASITAVGTVGGPLPVMLSPPSGTVATAVDPGGWGTLDWDDILVSPDDWDLVLLIRRITLTIESTLPAAGTNLEWIYVRTTEAGTGTIAEPTTGWRSFSQTPSADEGDLDLWVAGGGVDRTWGSSGGGAAGQRVAVHIGKRNTITGDRHYYGYEAITCTPPGVTNPTDYSGFTQDVNAAGINAAAALLDAQTKARARVTAGTAGVYIIGLPDYNYGALSAANWDIAPVAGQKIILQAINKNTACPHFGGGHIAGAKFTSIDISGRSRQGFRFVNVDRSGLGWAAIMVNLNACTDVEFAYSRVMTSKKPAAGWPHNAGGGTGAWMAEKGISVDAPVGAGRPNGVTIYRNHIYGLINDAVYWNAADNLIIEECVFEETGTDDLKSGGTSRWVTLKNNWGSRRRNQSYTAGQTDPWSHSDFIQLSGSGSLIAHTIVGNVMMLEAVLEEKLQLPIQFIFSNGSFSAVDWVVENNITVTNTTAGVQVAGSNGSNNRVNQNTLLRVWDYIMPGSATANPPYSNGIHGCGIAALNGGVEARRNVECMKGVTSNGWGSRVYNMSAVDVFDPNYTASSAGYEAANTTNTFYEIRPKSGTDTHWATAGLLWGAAARFKEVIVDKVGFPQVGPGWPAWKRQYDRRDQILAAAG